MRYSHQTLFQWALGLLLIVLLTRIVTVNIADFYLQRAYDLDVHATRSVLTWQQSNSTGHYLSALLARDDNPQQAEEHLYRALLNNPADVRPLGVLAGLLADEESGDKTDRIVSLASSRMPANKSLHLTAANYWVQRNDLDRALHEWNLALAINPAFGNQLFPVFARVLGNAQLRSSLDSYAMEPPVWWDEFTRHVASSDNNPEDISVLLGMRAQSGVPLSDVERQVYIEEYMATGQWREAFLVWVEGLSPEQRRELAGIYNGSFELPVTKTAFDWQISSSRHIKLAVRKTLGADRRLALQIRFSNAEARFRNLRQYLLLPAGNYQLTAIKRTERLSGRGRLKWFVRCAEDKRVIADSQAIISSREWEEISFEFRVPVTNCDAQEVSLESVGKHAFDHKLTGTLWVDNVRIHRTGS